jgi:hypothetical protein
MFKLKHFFELMVLTQKYRPIKKNTKLPSAQFEHATLGLQNFRLTATLGHSLHVLCFLKNIRYTYF